MSLEATISPVVQGGCTVESRTFDVDDPFDQLRSPNGADNYPIANVELIDNDIDGVDNRPNGEPPQSHQATTDENGEARVTFTVSVQPGNNYRAAASLLQDAVQDQVAQTDADNLRASAH